MKSDHQVPDSVACREIPAADYVHVESVPVPPGRRRSLPTDPAELARRVFDVSAASAVVRGLFRIRQRLVRFIGVAPAERDVFTVSEVVGGEALIAVTDTHLDFCAGVSAVDGAVRVVTTVRLKGWRGRVYFAPVRLAHPLVIRAMLRSAVERD